RAWGAMRLGPWQLTALLVGGTKVAGWIVGIDPLLMWGESWAQDISRALDFVAFPLLIFGLSTLVAASRSLVVTGARPVLLFIGGPLRDLARQHLRMRVARAGGLLLIVSMVTALAVYPTVMTAVFNDKTSRGAAVQLGGQVDVTVPWHEVTGELD